MLAVTPLALAAVAGRFAVVLNVSAAMLRLAAAMPSLAAAMPRVAAAMLACPYCRAATGVVGGHRKSPEGHGPER